MSRKQTEAGWERLQIGQKFVFSFDRAITHKKISNASYYTHASGSSKRITKRWRNRVEAQP